MTIPMRKRKLSRRRSRTLWTEEKKKANLVPGLWKTKVRMRRVVQYLLPQKSQWLDRNPR